MTEAYGFVLAVLDEPVDCNLTAVSAASDTTLNVDTTAGFPESGTLTMLGDLAVSESVPYTAVDRDSLVITLGSGLVNSYGVGDVAELSPRQIRRLAWVQTGTVPVTILLTLVPANLRDTLPTGVRGNAEREQVLIDMERAVILDAQLLEPNILGVDAPLTDGAAPGTSPTPTVQGGIGYLAVKWTGSVNNDALTYEVHVSTTTGFTPDASTFAGEIGGTIFFIRKMPDGSDLAYLTDYFVKIVAKDDDGSAAAGAQGVGQMIEANTPDIAVEAITAGNILAGTITAEQFASVLTITNKMIAGSEAGQRVEIDEDGIRLISPTGQTIVTLPTDPDSVAQFSGSLIAADLTVDDGFRLLGEDNFVESAGQLNVREGVGNPSSPPSVSVTWDSLDITGGAGQPVRGLWYDAAGGAGGATPSYLYCENIIGGRLVEANASTGAVTRTHSFNATTPFQQPLGVTRVGSNIFVLFLETTSSLVWVPAYAYYNQYHQWIYVPGHYESSSTSNVKLRKITQSSMATVSNTDVSSVASSDGANEYPGLGSDGTNVCILGRLSKRTQPQIIRYSTTPTFVDSIAMSDLPGTDDDIYNTVSMLSMVLSGGLWWISYEAYIGQHGQGQQSSLVAATYAFNTSGVYQPNHDFSLNGFPMRGTAWDATVFHTIGTVEQISHHTTWDWTTESDKYWAAYSWYDSVATTHETSVSSTANTTMVRRAQLNVSALPALPGAGGGDDPNSIRVYTNRGAAEPTGGTPVRFSGYLQGNSSAGSRTLTLSTFDNAGSPPENPSVSDFTGTPGLIQAEGGEWFLSGDGTIFGFEDTTLFGDGSDGSAVFDGSATVLGLAPSSGIYTLTRDLFLVDMQVDGGATIDTDGFRIFVTNTFTNNGIVHNDGVAGADASGSTGGIAGVSGTSAANPTYPPTTSGARGEGREGRDGVGGGASGSAASSWGSAHVFGGLGGAGGSTGPTNNQAGGAAGGSGSALQGPVVGAMHKADTAIQGWTMQQPTSITLIGGGSGAGGGGVEDNSGAGGGGGSGGGLVGIFAKNLLNSGTIRSHGGNGGNANATNKGIINGAGGGGGGGTVVEVYAQRGGAAPTATGGTAGFRAGTYPIAGTFAFTISSTTDGTAFASGSATPVANTDYLIYIVNTKATTPDAVSSITQAGLGSFSEVATVVNAAATMRTSIWKARCTAATAGVLTVNFGGTQTGCFAGMHSITLDTNDVSTFVTQSKTAVVAAGSPVTITFDSTIGLHNNVFAVCGQTTNTAPAPGTGYSNMGTSTIATPNAGYRAIQLTSPPAAGVVPTTPSFTGTGAADLVAVAVEVQAQSLPTAAANGNVGGVYQIEI